MRHREGERRLLLVVAGLRVGAVPQQHAHRARGVAWARDGSTRAVVLQTPPVLTRPIARGREQGELHHTRHSPAVCGAFSCSCRASKHAQIGVSGSTIQCTPLSTVPRRKQCCVAAAAVAVVQFSTAKAMKTLCCKPKHTQSASSLRPGRCASPRSAGPCCRQCRARPRPHPQAAARARACVRGVRIGTPGWAVSNRMVSYKATPVAGRATPGPRSWRSTTASLWTRAATRRQRGAVCSNVRGARPLCRWTAMSTRARFR